MLFVIPGSLHTDVEDQMRLSSQGYILISVYANSQTRGGTSVGNALIEKAIGQTLNREDLIMTAR